MRSGLGKAITFGGVLALLLSAAVLGPASAQADRRASESESRQMWNAVDAKYGLDGCVERRGQISTARTKKKYGTVIIADSHCGNGQYVLSKRRHAAGSHWRVLGAGSDWGSPDRCQEDLRRIPRAVLEDFFGSGYCER